MIEAILFTMLATVLPECGDTYPHTPCVFVSETEFWGQPPQDFVFDGTNRGSDSFHYFGTHGGEYINPADITHYVNEAGIVTPYAINA